MKPRMIPSLIFLLFTSMFCLPTLGAARISDYVIIHNDTSVKMSLCSDGAYKGEIDPNRRSSWHIGDEEDRSSYVLQADGKGVAAQDVVTGNYSNYTWRVNTR